MRGPRDARAADLLYYWNICDTILRKMINILDYNFL